MTLEQDVVSYIAELRASGDVFTRSHLALKRLWEAYGRTEVELEIEKQLTTRNHATIENR